MPPRFRLLPLAIALATTIALPAAAQQIDFGDDASPWANDGECDDPRFQGPGMTTTPLLDSDRGHDATDCRNAFNAGQVTLVGGTPPSGTTGKPTPGQQPTAGGINFGDDSGQWANDGECDDRRFVGQGMATVLSWEYVGRDATDCRRLSDSGAIRLWNWTEAQAATQCAAIDFGNDSGPYPNDGECDDPRFDGPGAGYALNPDMVRVDASDCRRLCEFGLVALRDY